MNKALTEYIRITFDGQTDRAYANKALNDPDAVYQLVHSNECGFWEWALDIGDDFWLCTWKTKREAIAWISKMGLTKKVDINKSPRWRK